LSGGTYIRNRKRSIARNGVILPAELGRKFFPHLSGGIGLSNAVTRRGCKQLYFILERAKAYVSFYDGWDQKEGILASACRESATRITPTRVRYSAKKIRVGTGRSMSKIWLDGILETIAKRRIRVI